MAENYMDDGDGPDTESPAEESSESKAVKTALIPIDFFEGKDLEPGVECKIRIAKVHDDQVEAEYVPHTESEAPELGEEPAAAVPSGMEEMMG